MRLSGIPARRRGGRPGKERDDPPPRPSSPSPRRYCCSEQEAPAAAPLPSRPRPATHPREPPYNRRAEPAATRWARKAETSQAAAAHHAHASAVRKTVKRRAPRAGARAPVISAGERPPALQGSPGPHDGMNPRVSSYPVRLIYVVQIRGSGGPSPGGVIRERCRLRARRARSPHRGLQYRRGRPCVARWSSWSQPGPAQ